MASNRLFCVQIEKCRFSNSSAAAGEPDLTVLRLEPSGFPPPARYMHSMTYFHDRSLITIAGGRNDQLSAANIILSDLWVLRLDDLEY